MVNAKKLSNKNNFDDYESHGRHWEAIISNKTELLRLVEQWSHQGEAIIIDEEQNILLYKYEENMHFTIYIFYKNDQFLTSYPVVIGPKSPFELETIDKWSNDIEGVLDLRSLDNQVMITCFDTTMYKNRSMYQENSLIDARMGSIAYYVDEERDFGIEVQGRTVSTRNTLILFPLEDGPPDEYRFQTFIRRVKDLKMFGREYYVMHVSLFKLIKEKSQQSVDHYMIVAKDNVQEGYEPKPGDGITGVMWLQAQIEI